MSNSRRAVFEWSGEDVYIRRSTDPQAIKLEIDITLCLSMGWIKRKPDGQFDLGPNLHYSLYHKTGTDANSYVKLMYSKLSSGYLWRVVGTSDGT